MFTPTKRGGGGPHFWKCWNENAEIIFKNNNEGLYITLETKFHTCTSINEDFEIFTPKKGGGSLFGKFQNVISEF